MADAQLYRTLRLARIGAVLRITLDRPERRDAPQAAKFLQRAGTEVLKTAVADRSAPFA